jgi:peroxiredoxin
MATAYDILGIQPEATPQELDAAYAARLAAYDPATATELGGAFAAVAAQRRAELAAAYRLVRPAINTPRRLTPEAERRRDRETIVALLVLVVLALSVPVFRDAAVPQRTVVATAADSIPALDAAPGFTLQTPEGESVSLADFKGKVVLVNFWATWCPPCVREIPRLARIAEEGRAKGLVVLGVNTTFQDDPAKVEQFMREHRISYPVLLDPQGEAGRVYPVQLMPTSFVIDRTGKIAITKVGEIDETTLQEQITALLDAPQP